MSSRTRRIGPGILGAALLALIGCSAPTAPDARAASTFFAEPAATLLAGHGEHAEGQILARPRIRAWRIRATVAVTPATAPVGCLVYFTSVIEGQATHLGTFEGVGTTCITEQIAPDPNPPFVPAGPAPYARATFHNPLWTLTAANGDELWLESFDATAVLSLVDNSLIARGSMRVLGGTGRFEGATGMADVGAVNQDGQGPDDFSGSGWIRF